MAGGQPAVDLAQDGRLLAAAVDRRRAAGMEPAAGRRVGRIRRVGPLRLNRGTAAGSSRSLGRQPSPDRLHPLRAELLWAASGALALVALGFSPLAAERTAAGHPAGV
jgi:hypothetical protein